MSESPPPGWFPASDRPGQMKWWDGSGWTEKYKPAPERRIGGLRASVITFCVALGVAAFFLLVILDVSTNGVNCGAVVSPTTYSGGLDSAEVNSACKSARDSRAFFAVAAGVILTGLSLGGFKLAQKDG